jgi:hypothetical protein
LKNLKIKNAIKSPKTGTPLAILSWKTVPPGISAKMWATPLDVQPASINVAEQVLCFIRISITKINANKIRFVQGWNWFLFSFWLKFLTRSRSWGYRKSQPQSPYEDRLTKTCKA